MRHGLEVALDAGLPLPALEAHTALAKSRSAAAAVEHREAARALADQIAATISDESLRRGFLDSARSALD